MPRTKLPAVTIARIAYEADREYCKTSKNETVGKPWADMAKTPQNEFSLLVRTILEHEDWQGGDLHSYAMRRLQKHGWNFGEQYSEDEKTTPLMVEHHLTSPDNINRNTLLLNVVRALASV